jgi:hypothetical protein
MEARAAVKKRRGIKSMGMEKTPGGRRTNEEILDDERQVNLST